MSYKLQHDQGIVPFLYRAGKDMVKDSMAISEAEKLLKNRQNTIKEDPTFKPYTLSVNDLIFFIPVKKRTVNK